MFDFGWSELMIVAAVAVVVVGPKELPRLMRSIGQYVGKAKAMASDLQSQFTDMAHQSELDEIRKSVTDLGDENPLKEFEESLNSMATEGEGFNTSLDNVTKRESGTDEIEDDPGLVEDYDDEGEMNLDDDVPEPEPSEVEVSEPDSEPEAEIKTAKTATKTKKTKKTKTAKPAKSGK